MVEIKIMLDIKKIRESEQEVRQGLKNRGADTAIIEIPS